MMRWKWKTTVLVACLVAGCSPSFKDEAEELEYLSSISQPSVQQFRRKKEIEQKVIKALAAQRQAEDARQAVELQAFEARERAENAAKAKAALEEAQKWEQNFYPGTARADMKYRDLVIRYPGTPEAAIAERRIEEIREAVERREQEEAAKK